MDELPTIRYGKTEFKEYVPPNLVKSWMLEFRKPLNKSLHEKWLWLYWTYRLIKWRVFGYDQVIVNGKARRATEAEQAAWNHRTVHDQKEEDHEQ